MGGASGSRAPCPEQGRGPGAGMRLRSGVLAAGCLLLQAMGVAIFLRGFFPMAVRARPRGEPPGDGPAEPAPPGSGEAYLVCKMLKFC